MKIRNLIHSLIPPIFWYVTEKFKKSNNPKYIWEGVYDSFEQIKENRNDYFESTNWSQEALEEIRKINKNYLQTNKGLPSIDAVGEQAFLPMLLALISRDKKELKILDFGGGLGADYFYVKSNLVGEVRFEYVIVDSKRVKSVGEKFHKKNKQIKFLSKLPIKNTKFDIVHIDSALQYIKNYSELIKNLTEYGAQYILLVRVSAGKFPTFASTQQNMPGMRTFYWFVNIDELKNILDKNGYKLIFWNMSESVYNQDNFENDYQMIRPMNLLFRRK